MIVTERERRGVGVVVSAGVVKSIVLSPTNPDSNGVDIMQTQNKDIAKLNQKSY
jgi:hypothetical protein